MRVCPECGDVFPDESRECSAHGAVLRDWTEMTEVHTHTGVVTEVDTRRVEDERRFEFGQVVGEIAAAPAAHGLRGAGSGKTPPIIIAEDTTQRNRAPQVGCLLGHRYRLGERIGVGGYGAVFDAIDVFTEERVAVKVLSPAASQSAELVTRFHREAIAASRVRHPHIVEVVDFDVDADGTHFIVMEYLDGVDLAEVIDEEGALPPARALAIAIRCASALAAAHGAGILHRDLKPANVFLVERDGQRDFVKIIDFGISKLTRAAGHYTDLTSASKVVGTPCYMSPEQARGDELDGRSDVYALGIILFEMLTGERPFTGRSTVEILANHAEAPRVPPSTLQAPLADLPGLDDLVVQAIAAWREERPASMAAFADAMLERLEWVDPRAAAALRGNRRGRSASIAPTSPVRRRRMLGGAIAAVAAVALGLLAVLAPDTEEPATGPAASVPPPGVPAPAALPEPEPEPEALESEDPARSTAPDPKGAAAEVAAAPAKPERAAPRSVRVTSTPPGVTVRLGDRALGVTPLEVQIEPADEPVSLTLRKPGWRPAVLEVEPGVKRAHADLQRLARPAASSTTPPVQGIEEW